MKQFSMLKAGFGAVAGLMLCGGVCAALLPASVNLLKVPKPVGVTPAGKKVPKAQSPMKLAPGAEFYGIVTSMQANVGLPKYPVLATIPTTDSDSFVSQFQTIGKGSARLSAAGKENQYYCSWRDNKNEQTVYAGYDLETGEQNFSATYTKFQYEWQNFAMSTDPTDNKIYGINFDNNTHYQLVTLSFSAPSTVTVTPVGPVNYNYRAIAINGAGEIYGIAEGAGFETSDAYLVKIDKTTAAETVIGSTGFQPQWSDDICFDTANNTLYWTANNDNDFGLYTVNVETAALTKLATYSGGPEVSGLYIKQPPYVAPGTPAAPATATLSYADGTMNLTWDAVTTDTTGEVLEGDVTYKVTRMPGEIEVATGLTATSFTETVAETGTFVDYYYEVRAVSGDLTSGATKSNAVTIGYLAPPYTSNFYDNGIEGENMTIIDANNDGKKWNVSGNKLSIGYNTSVDMDDWAITPGFRLEAGKAYRLEFKTWCKSSNYEERLEVKMGNAPTAEAMTITVMEPLSITWTSGEQQSLAIVPQTDGDYYIGFHGISDRDRYDLYVSDYTITSPISATVPAAVSNLTATAGEYGALKATVAFKAPALSSAGIQLTTLSKIEVKRGDNVVKTFENVAAGTELSFEDTLTEAGTVTYSVTAYNGEEASEAAEVSVYVGYEQPNAPTAVSLSRTATPGEAQISWNAPFADINGRPFGPESLTYTVARYNAEGELEVLDTEVTGTSYTFQAVEPGTQDFVQCAVYAVCNGGRSASVNTPMIAVGTPYTSFVETFANNQPTYAWMATTANSQGKWSYTDEYSQDEGSSCIQLYYRQDSSYANLTSGLIDLGTMADPQLTFWALNFHEANVNIVEAYAKKASDNDWTLLKSTQMNLMGADPNAWGRIKADLSQFSGEVIQIMFKAVSISNAYVFLDNISIGSRLAKDAAALTVTAPAVVDAGDVYTAKATVANEGTQAATFNVDLYVDGKLAGTETVENVAADETREVEFALTMSPVKNGKAALQATVVYAGDQDDFNDNSTTAYVLAKHSNLPVPENFEGHMENNAVVLTWDDPVAPNLAGDQVTEDFESGEGFAPHFGDWIFVDVDQSPVGGFNGAQFPGIVKGETTGSFWVMDRAYLKAEGKDLPAPFVDGHSGDKFIFTMGRNDNGQSDDWAISPVLDGSAQTITFKARSLMAGTEKIEILYSTGSTDPADFIKIDGVGGEVPNPGINAWNNYEVNLPEGARRFAIRSWAAPGMLLMLDDFTYIAGSQYEGLELTGFHVYRDGVLLAEVDKQDGNTYTDEEGVGGTHEYHVKAIYNMGHSAPTEPLSFIVSGVAAVNGSVSIYTEGQEIVIAGAEGTQVMVADAAGAVYFNGVAEAPIRIRVENGVYVVKAGKNVTKLMIK
ncbi:MAG: choice-of-anchor J domain-containing protein [Muribaculaceae bacterium]|nr:choice-of-anchor J domain-containing protein [Muribaculaceae bacterium]